MMSSHAVTVAGFLLLGAAFLALEIAGRLPGARVPTLDRLLAGIMVRRSGRIGLLLAWWWLGWHFLAH